MANQRGQQQASQPRPPMPWKPRHMSELYGGMRFDPNGRCLVRTYLTPKAIRGRLPADEVKDVIPDDVDVYGARPETLPFHRCNRGAGGKVWGHFFTTRPATGGDVLYVPGGLWVRYGEEKAYADAGGDVLGYRRRFAFHGEDGKLTAWRMKEFRLNEGAAAFRGVAFHPVARDLVAWKVYNDVEEQRRRGRRRGRGRERRSGGDGGGRTGCRCVHGDGGRPDTAAGQEEETEAAVVAQGRR